MLKKFRCSGLAEGYVVGVPSIVRFALSEMAVIRREFLKAEFESILGKLLGIYLPADAEKPTQLPEIAEYFL